MPDVEETAIATRAQSLRMEYHSREGWLDPVSKGRFGVRHGKLSASEIVDMIEEVDVETKDQQKIAETANEKAQTARAKYEQESRKAVLLRDRRDVLKLMLAEVVGIPK